MSKPKRCASRFLGFILLLVLLVALSSLLIWTASGPRFGIAPEARAPIMPARQPGTPYLTFVAVGDTGNENLIQHAVADAMASVCDTQEISFAVMLGDNFYPAGVNSVRDPRWVTSFEQLFDPLTMPVPFYACLGNHDVKGDVEAQIDYGQGASRWQMPDRYYSFTQPVGENTSVFFIVLDTTTLIESEGSRSQEQLDWLKAQLLQSAADWKIVMGHHPALPTNEHPKRSEFEQEFRKILVRGGTDLYLCGHEHHLSVREDGAGLLQVISGAGSELHDTRRTSGTLFASPEPGFALVRISANELIISLIGADHRLKYVRVLLK